MTESGCVCHIQDIFLLKYKNLTWRQANRGLLAARRYRRTVSGGNRCFYSCKFPMGLWPSIQISRVMRRQRGGNSWVYISTHSWQASRVVTLHWVKLSRRDWRTCNKKTITLTLVLLRHRFWHFLVSIARHCAAVCELLWFCEERLKLKT